MIFVGIFVSFYLVGGFGSFWVGIWWVWVVPYVSSYALPRWTQQLKVVSSSFNSIQELKISYPCLQRKLIIFKIHSNIYQIITTELPFCQQCIHDFFTVLLWFASEPHRLSNVDKLAKAVKYGFLSNNRCSKLHAIMQSRVTALKEGNVARTGKGRPIFVRTDNRDKSIFE